MKRVSVTCGTESRDLISMTEVPKGEKSKKETRKSILRYTGWKSSKFDQKHQPTDSVCSADTEQHKSKKGTKHFIVKLLKTKHKNLKRSQQGNDKVHTEQKWE